MKLLSTLLLLLTLASCGSGGGSAPVVAEPINPESLCHPYKEIIKFAVNLNVPFGPECGGINIIGSYSLLKQDPNGDIYKDLLITPTEVIVSTYNKDTSHWNAKVYENIDGVELRSFVHDPNGVSGNDPNSVYELLTTSGYLSGGWNVNEFTPIFIENTGDDTDTYLVVDPAIYHLDLINENITLTVIDTNEDIL